MIYRRLSGVAVTHLARFAYVRKNRKKFCFR